MKIINKINKQNYNSKIDKNVAFNAIYIQRIPIQYGKMIKNCEGSKIKESTY